MIRVLKKYLLAGVMFMIYLSAVVLLVKQFTVYQMAYHYLSKLVSHSSVELYAGSGEE